jgi:hypothetical protein
VQEFFGEHIGKRGLWLQRSPDLASPDLFLWEFLKERVYSKNPRRLEELKNNTEETVANIDPETLRKDARNN